MGCSIEVPLTLYSNRDICAKAFELSRARYVDVFKMVWGSGLHLSAYTLSRLSLTRIAPKSIDPHASIIVSVVRAQAVKVSVSLP